MPRGGWSHLEVPSGWIQVLRGPRPKSVRWPFSNERSSSDVPQPRGRWRQPQQLKGGPVPRPAIQTRP